MLFRRQFTQIAFAIAGLFAIVNSSSAAFISTSDITASLNGVGTINATAAHGVFSGNNTGTEPTLLTLLNSGTSTLPLPGTVKIESDTHVQYDIKISSTGMFSTAAGEGIIPPVNGSTVDLLDGTPIVLAPADNWSLVGTTNQGQTDGPFQSFGNGATTIELDNAITGRFVIALKAGDFYAVYAFDIATSVNRFVFNLPITNPPGNSDLALSHAALYTAPISGTVDPNATIAPEPASMAIFGLGALGMGFIARRRRQTSVIAA